MFEDVARGMTTAETSCADKENIDHREETVQLDHSPVQPGTLSACTAFT